jgi:hypothetical protein
MRALKILAAVYETTWDRLVDVNDLEVMPAHERQEFLEIGRRRGGNSPDLLVSRQYRRRPGAAPSGADLPFGRPGGGGKSAIVAEPLTITAPERSSARSGSALPGKITHFTGRDGPMAELRTRITEHAPQGTVVTIYAIDGMAGVGKRRLLVMPLRSSPSAIPMARSGSISTAIPPVCRPVNLPAP